MVKFFGTGPVHASHSEDIGLCMFKERSFILQILESDCIDQKEQKNNTLITSIEKSIIIK